MTYWTKKDLRRVKGKFVAKPGYHLVPCDGDAHSNAYIDNCQSCAPLWGQVSIPVAYATLNEYRDANMDEQERAFRARYAR